jgi:transcription regulator MmyB-like protein
LGNGRLDILAAHALGRALDSEMYVDPPGRSRPPDSASSTLGRPTSTSNWESAAYEIVAVLRSEAGRNAYDHALSDLVGEFSTRNEEFRARRATQGANPLNRGNAGPIPAAFILCPDHDDQRRSMAPTAQVFCDLPTRI